MFSFLTIPPFTSSFDCLCCSGTHIAVHSSFLQPCQVKAPTTASQPAIHISTYLPLYIAEPAAAVQQLWLLRPTKAPLYPYPHVCLCLCCVRQNETENPCNWIDRQQRTVDGGWLVVWAVSGGCAAAVGGKSKSSPPRNTNPPLPPPPTRPDQRDRLCRCWVLLSSVSWRKVLKCEALEQRALFRINIFEVLCSFPVAGRSRRFIY